MSTTSNGSKETKANSRAIQGRTSHAGSLLPVAGDTGVSRLRIIIADSEAIFRVGMSKIFAAQPDLEVVAQTETLSQTLSVVASTAADVVLFESGISPNPADAISEVARRVEPHTRLILVTSRVGEQETVDFLRRGVRGILPRGISPELLVRCVRKVAAGETWLDKQGVNWVIDAYRSQAMQGSGPQQRMRLTEKEMMIIGGVTQGMKNKDIAREVGTTEQVVKNYLRKIYDKLNVADRLELALYSMHHRLLEGYGFPEPELVAETSGNAMPTGEQAAAGPAPQPANEMQVVPPPKPQIVKRQVGKL
ncbi:MAG TPA: response regulator transcription factor [Terriglobales bacterium]|nr:response regulator transcription factor [Terriglobales bacterium]